MLSLLPDLPKETAGILDNVREPSHLPLSHRVEFSGRARKHRRPAARLEAVDPVERAPDARSGQRQLGVLKTKDQIAAQIRDEMTRSQHDYVLRRQMRTILDELGEAGDEDEVDALRDKIARAELPPEAEQAARRQLSRLRSMQPQAAEYNVARNYVEWLSELPWNRTTPDHVDVKEVARCLDEDHHGLERVKKRIIEFSAIRQLRSDKRGPILLFIGPPGVGTPPLGRSIARAMGRRYGHLARRRARRGRGSRAPAPTWARFPVASSRPFARSAKNPVLVLDEIDKMDVDMRGDPAAALSRRSIEQNGTS